MFSVVQTGLKVDVLNSNITSISSVSSQNGPTFY